MAIYRFWGECFIYSNIRREKKVKENRKYSNSSIPLITLSMVPVWCLRMVCPHTDRIRAHCRLNYHNVYFVGVVTVCPAALYQQFEPPNVFCPVMLCRDAVLMVFATLFGERETSWLVRSTWSFASLQKNEKKMKKKTFNKSVTTV